MGNWPWWLGLAVVVIISVSIMLVWAAQVILSGLSGWREPEKPVEIPDDEAEKWANFDPSQD